MQTIVNLGTGGADLNGQNGSTTSADSNDALLLDWPGDNAGNYVYLPGVSGNGLVPALSPDTGYQPAGDFTITVHCAADDWTPAATQYLLSRRLASSARSYWFFLRTDGKLQLNTSSTGTTDSTASVSTVAVPGTDGEALWLRVTMDLDNGASGNTVTFYTSTDGSSWSALGSPVVNAGTTSIYDHGGVFVIGGQFVNVSANNFAGKMYRVTVADGLHTSSTPFIDVDCSVITSGSATSLVSTVGGKTFNIVRSTSGRKSVAVVSRVWLFGTDDFVEVGDNPLLDFGVSEPLTVVAAHRVWNTQGTNDTVIAKKANTTNTTQGWSVSGGSSTALAGQAQIGDGSAGVTATSSNRVVGELTITAAVRDVSSDTLTVYRNGTAGSAVTDTTTGSLSNAEVVRIARLSGAGTEYADVELVGVAVFRRALSAAEVSQISSYYQARLS